MAVRQADWVEQALVNLTAEALAVTMAGFQRPAEPGGLCGGRGPLLPGSSHKGRR